MLSTKNPKLSNLKKLKLQDSSHL